MADYKLVDIEQLEAGLTATADAIRAKTGATEEIPWDAETGMAANIEEVFDAGKNAELDEFWEKYQDSGNRINYSYAFSCMDDSNFKPLYGITSKITNIDRMFYRYKGTKGPMIFIENGLPFDTSGVTTSHSVTFSSSIIEVPPISTLGLGSIGNIFYYANGLKTIQKLILKNDGSQNLSANIFGQCYNLENLTIEGTIGKNGFDIHWSTLLSKDSITSIINALSATTTGLTVTLSLTAVNNAFETSEGVANGSTSEEWLALAATKSNWTISLV